MIDIVCASLNHRSPRGLEYIPKAWQLHTSSEVPWAYAVNRMLEKTKEDVLHIDDDIEILPSTFDLLDLYYDSADIFGFSLLCPNGAGGWRIHSSGAKLAPRAGDIDLASLDADLASLTTPVYVAHVCASCMYIKRSVIEAGLRFPEWPGAHYEDVVFTLEAWLAGFRVCRLPSVALHHSHPSGIGLTKLMQPTFNQHRQINEAKLKSYFVERGIFEACLERRIPLGTSMVIRGQR
jgi:GT2 family glycosyltransferase